MAEAKYNSAEHKAMCAEYARQIAAGQGWCAETICLHPTRYIPPGTPRKAWHAAHTDDGLHYKGPAHTRCNTADGGRRRHHPTPTPPTRWVL